MTRMIVIETMILALCLIATWAVKCNKAPERVQIVAAPESEPRVTTIESDGLKCGILIVDEAPVAMSCVNKMPGLGE